MRMVRRVGLVAGAVLGALVMVGAPAQADGGAYTSDGNGSVWFESYGEHFYVNDWAADGHGVVGELDRVVCGGPGGAHCWWAQTARVYNGNGFHGPAKHKNLSITEGKRIRYRACLVDGEHGSPYRCGSWKFDKA